MSNIELDLDNALTMFDEVDAEFLKALDPQSYNENGVYNVPGFKSVRSELSHSPVVISGELPKDLEGVYIRNGTNPQFDPLLSRYHMFGGAGMLHQIQIKDGMATYSNTYIRTPRFEIERHAGRDVYVNVADMVTAGPLFLDIATHVEKKMADGVIPRLPQLEMTQSSTSIQYHAGKLYALNEGGFPFVMDVQTQDGQLIMSGQGRFETWDGRLAGAFSAHPRIAPESGDFYSVNTLAGGQLSAAHVHHGALVECTTFSQEAADGLTMALCHDCFLTENYLVFADPSLRASPEFLFGPDQSMLRFDPEYKMRWGVLPRRFKAGDKPRWFTTDHSGFIWHMVNGWEEKRADGGTDIVLYAPMYETYPSDIPIHTPQEPPAKLYKWVLDLKDGAVREQRRLLDHGYERPSSNLALISKKSRYAYLLNEKGDGYMGKGVLKYDLSNEQEVSYFDYGDYYGGEALFVARTGAVAEDDGYLLELLMADDQACLIVIDATTMCELARLRLPQRVPFGVHACWLDREKLSELARPKS